jgi:hypothetical protein
MCPLFYSLIDNPSRFPLDILFDNFSFCLLLDVNSIFKQALDRSPAYGSIQDVLQSFNADEVINDKFSS